MKTVDLYLIRAVSNLHVGSGEGDFSVVDKQVQRDPVTGLPVIHASGFKGALREAMEYAGEHEEDAVVSIFGADPKRKDGKIQQGLNNFFDGKLLALPIRSSHHFFYVATCESLLAAFAADLETFSPGHALIEPVKSLSQVAVEKNNPRYFGPAAGEISLEDWTATHDAAPVEDFTDLLGPRIALLHNDDFRTLAGELPIIARNYLENGISRNLWYEETVPREARFYSVVTRHADNDELNTFLENNKNLVQIGANATVGYGLCELKTI
jgi:CRISPR-associated protein Cmr4